MPHSGWTYEGLVSFAGGTSGANKQVLVRLEDGWGSLFYYADCKSAGEDLRFYDGATQCKYFIEQWNTGGYTFVWVEVPTNGVSNIVMEWGNSSASDAQETWGGNIILPATSTSISGWTNDTAEDDKYPLGASSESGTGGTLTHTHTRNTLALGNNSGTSRRYGTGTTTQRWIYSTHTHTVSVDLSAANHEPDYIKLAQMYRNTIPAILDQNLIVLADASVSATNYTRYSSADSRYIKWASSSLEGTGGTGISGVHNHGTMNSDATTMYSYAGNTTQLVADTGHIHVITTGNNSAYTVFPRVTTYLYKLTGNAGIISGIMAMFSVLPPLGWTRKSAWDGYHLMGYNGAGTTTASSVAHTHGFTTPTGVEDLTNNIYYRTSGTTMYSAPTSHTHTVSGTSGSTSPTLSYHNVILAVRNTTDTAVTGLTALGGQVTLPKTISWDILKDRSSTKLSGWTIRAIRNILQNVTLYSAPNGGYTLYAPKAGMDRHGRIYFTCIYEQYSTKNICLLYLDPPYSGSGDWESKFLTEHSTGLSGLKVYLAMAVGADKKIHVAYCGTDTTYYPDYMIFYLRYDPKTDTVEVSKRVARCGTSDQTEVNIAVDSSGYAHIVWLGKGWGTYTTKIQVCYARSDESEKSSGTPPTLLTDEDADHGNPVINIRSSGELYAYWNGIKRKIYTTSWATEESLTSGAIFHTVFDQQNNIHLAYLSGGALYYKKYTNSTSTWGDAETVASSGVGNYSVQVAFNGESGSQSPVIICHASATPYRSRLYQKLGSIWLGPTDFQASGSLPRDQTYTDTSFVQPSRDRWNAVPMAPLGALVVWGQYDDTPISGTHHYSLSRYNYRPMDTKFISSQWIVEAVTHSYKVSAWDIYLQRSTDKVSAWNVLIGYSDQISSDWIITIPQEIDKVSSWQILASTSMNKVSSWEIDATAQYTSEKVSSWDIKERWVIVKACDWMTLPPSQEIDRTCSWDIMVINSIWIDSTWIIFHGKRIPSAWIINYQATPTVGSSWAIYLSNSEEKGVAWGIVQRHVIDRNSSWIIAFNPTIEIPSAWEIQLGGHFHISSAWYIGTSGAIGKVVNWTTRHVRVRWGWTTWIIHAPHYVPKDVLWDVLLQRTVERTSTWAINYMGSQPKTVSWIIRGWNWIEESSAWNIIIEGDLLLNSSWITRVPGSIEKPCSWDMELTTVRWKSAAWVVRYQGEIIKPCNWALLLQRTKLPTSSWIIAGSEDSSKVSAWIIHRQVEEDISSDWEILRTISLTKVSTWLIIRSPPSLKVSAWDTWNLRTRWARSEWIIHRQGAPVKPCSFIVKRAVPLSIGSGWIVTSFHEIELPSAFILRRTVGLPLSCLWDLPNVRSTSKPSTWTVIESDSFWWLLKYIRDFCRDSIRTYLSAIEDKFIEVGMEANSRTPFIDVTMDNYDRAIYPFRVTVKVKIGTSGWNNDETQIEQSLGIFGDVGDETLDPDHRVTSGGWRLVKDLKMTVEDDKANPRRHYIIITMEYIQGNDTV